MIPRVTWVLAAAAGVWWWSSRPAPTAAAVEDEQLKLIPITGHDLFEAYAPDQCVPMIDELVTHPNWSIGVSTGSSGCFGYEEHARYDLHADGTVAFTRQGLTRTLSLTEDELAAVRGLNRLDCSDPSHDGYLVSIYGQAFSSESDLGEAVTTILDRATGRYVDARRAELGPVELELQVGRLRLEVADLTVRVRRGRRVISESTLTPEAYVDVVDAIIAGELDTVDEPDVRGALTVGRVTYAIDTSRWSRGPLQWLLRELVV